MIFVRIIDENGLFLRDAFVDELTTNTIETACPAGFILPRWDGEKWVEGGQLTEQPQTPPTAEERLTALEDAMMLLMF